MSGRRECAAAGRLPGELELAVARLDLRFAEEARRRDALGRIHRIEQARLLREAAALCLADRAAAALGSLLTRLLRLDRGPTGDGRLRAPAGLGVRDGFALDRDRWRQRVLEALTLARADGFAEAESLTGALFVLRGAESGASAGPQLGPALARVLLAAAACLDADPEVEALLAAVEFLDGAPDRGEARARAALARPTLALASDPERLRGSLELLRAFARDERGRAGASLPAFERARAAADEAERAAIDACALAIALGAGELHVARVAAVRLASVDPGIVPVLADLVALRGERARDGAGHIAPAARGLAGRLLASRNAAAAAVVLATLRGAGRVVARTDGKGPA